MAVLTLEDGKANTFERSTFQALSEALKEIASASVGAVLFTGRRGFFSAGLDLKVLPAISHLERVESIRAFGQTVLQLFLFPKPVVVAVSGHALGAGAMLALAADVRVGVEGNFRFGLNEVPIGMVVPTFGVEIARASVSPTIVTEMLLHGRVLTPPELLEHRIVEVVTPRHDALMSVALERAQALATLPGGPYTETKLRLRGQGAERAAAVLDRESEELVRGIGGA